MVYTIFRIMAEITKILVVEDDETGAKLLRELLESEFDLRIVHNGIDALAETERCRPDIILLDIMMPELNGYEVCRRIKTGVGAQIKVILVTAKARMEERLEGYKSGADDYISKPFDPEELLARVRIFDRLIFEEKQRQKAERRLKESRDLLERTVNLRTNELESINQKLISEIEKHKKTSEQNLRINAYLESSLDSAPDGVLLLDQHGRCSYANPVFLQLSGGKIEDFLGRTLKEAKSKFLSAETIDMLSKNLDSGSAKTWSTTAEELNIIHQNGESIPVSFSSSAIKDKAGQILGEIVFFKNVAEQKRMQDLMIQYEKMMSVGGLAAGMAHEINNPLSAILQSSQNIIRRLSAEGEKNVAVAEKYGINLQNLQSFLDEQRIPSFLEAIRNSGIRAAQIIEGMVNFSRKSGSQMALNDLNRIIEQALVLAESDYDLKKKYDFKDIKIVKDYDSSMPSVTCTEKEIQQVILNLIVNAAHALVVTKDLRPPVITIRTRFEKRWAKIEISDNGPGIEEKNRGKVFEPFFTTKPVGTGTGLGLAVSYMIITNLHQGSMELNTQPGEGTTFVIRLLL